MFIETVFKTTFGFSDELKITCSALNHVNNIRGLTSNMWFDIKGLSSTIKSVLITAILNKKTGGATSVIAPKRAGWRPRLVGVRRFRKFHKFISNLSEKTAPLRQLLRKDLGGTSARSFCSSEIWHLLSTSLKIFNPLKPVTLSVDASKSGLGAVYLQYGSPVAYAYRALTRRRISIRAGRERTARCDIYMQEISRFNLWSRSHHWNWSQAYYGNCKQSKPLHTAPARLQRMLLQLQRYNLKFIYRKGTELHIANALSRAYIPNSLRKEYIYLLHKGHPGTDATKRRAKDMLYWPSMMLEIDCTIASCQPCNSAKPHQQKEPRGKNAGLLPKGNGVQRTFGTNTKGGWSNS